MGAWYVNAKEIIHPRDLAPIDVIARVRKNCLDSSVGGGAGPPNSDLGLTRQERIRLCLVLREARSCEKQDTDDFGHE